MSLSEKEIKKSDRTVDLGGFKMRDEINPKIWSDDIMKPDVRKALLKIADDYFEGLDLEGVDIEDITMTGSLSNYNWSKYSDVDLHIIIDHKDMPMEQDVVDDYLKSKSDAWNDKHDIKIYGFDVEIYVQDRVQEHISSGVYSVLRNEWNIKPEKKKISINDQSVKNKSKRLMDMIDDLFDSYTETDGDKSELFGLIEKRADKIKDKIKKMRQCGLDEGGEYSVENMVFKVLRRNGMLERLGDIKTVAYDKSVTLESITESDGLEWMDEIHPNLDYSDITRPIEGDIVVCKPGFSNSNPQGVDNYGGSGYRDGRQFEVYSFSNFMIQPNLSSDRGSVGVVFPEGYQGIYTDAVHVIKRGTNSDGVN